jgi:hypothetical protein
MRFQKLKRKLAALLAFGLSWTTLNAQTNVPPRDIVPVDYKYAALATTMKAKGMDFEHIFQSLCKTALTNAATNPRVRLDDEVRAMFGGMWKWALNGGSPEFQGQNDKALHFLGGGAFEGYFDVGRSAAVIKEELDRQNPDNFFDMDDMAATMMGARWVDLATSGNTNQAHAWVELWASGKSTLSRSLPKLHWGHMEPGSDAPPEKIKAVLADVTAAMVPPEVPK